MRSNPFASPWIPKLPVPVRRRFSRCVALVAILMLGTASAPGRAIDMRTITTDSPYYAEFIGTEAPGLVTVDLRFTDTDHHVWGLVATPHDGDGDGVFGDDGILDFHLMLRDGGGVDPVRNTVRYADLQAHDVVHQVLRFDCSGTCRIPMPRLPQGELFVLSGFDFEFQNGDHHLEEIAVDPRPYRGYIDVTFADDGGEDPYWGMVTYLSVPIEAYLALETRRSVAPAHGFASVARRAGTAVLQGFRLAFTNGDHHLMRFTVDLSGDHVTVRLRDQNTDDPFTWSVDYLVLRD